MSIYRKVHFLPILNGAAPPQWDTVVVDVYEIQFHYEGDSIHNSHLIEFKNGKLMYIKEDLREGLLGLHISNKMVEPPWEGSLDYLKEKSRLLVEVTSD